MARKKKAAPAAPPQPEPYDPAGRTITGARPMTARELAAEGWTTGIHGAPVVLVLDDGTRLYPSRDAEGNGPGALFGVDAGGETFAVG
jgi:hypothetical protein